MILQDNKTEIWIDASNAYQKALNILNNEQIN
jgi:hypothetical protein